MSSATAAFAAFGHASPAASSSLGASEAIGRGLRWRLLSMSGSSTLLPASNAAVSSRVRTRIAPPQPRIAGTALAAAAVAAAALERSSLRRCGVAARRLRRRVVALRAANEALMTAEAEVDEEEDLIVENVMGRRTLSLWPGIEDALEDFAGLPIPKRLADAFTERGILKGSPIQEASMSKIKDGKHVIIHSPTGSGKTLAYLLPVLARLQPTMHVGAQVLILVPTPELALQITRELRWLVQVLCGFQGVCWFNPQVPQELACEVLLSRSGLWECIRKDTAIVITTPSIIVSELRSLQWEARKFSETLAYFMGSNMSAVIMDEVDALCPGEVKGRRKQQFGASEQVLDYVFDVVRSRYRNRPVQMVSASATANGKKVSRVLERILAKKYVKRRDMAYKLKPELVQQGSPTGMVPAAGPGEVRRRSTRNQKHVMVPEEIKHCVALLDRDDQDDLLGQARYELAAQVVSKLEGTIIVFVPEHVKLDAMVVKLMEAGVQNVSKYRSAVGLGQETEELANPELEDTRFVRPSQNKRSPPASQDMRPDKALEKSQVLLDDLADGVDRVLVAKMSAGRGIDLADVRYVVLFRLPELAGQYLHLSGRTGRMGRSGTAITLASSVERLAYCHRVEARLDIKFRGWDVESAKAFEFPDEPVPSRVSSKARMWDDDDEDDGNSRSKPRAPRRTQNDLQNEEEEDEEDSRRARRAPRRSQNEEGDNSRSAKGRGKGRSQKEEEDNSTRAKRERRSQYEAKMSNGEGSGQDE